MNSEILKLNSNKPMNSIIGICLVIILVSIIYRVFMYKENLDNEKIPKQDEEILIMFKFLFYSLLAAYIYVTFKRANFPDIDVLTFFTFLLACFEATHNFIISIGKWISSGIALLF